LRRRQQDFSLQGFALIGSSVRNSDSCQLNTRNPLKNPRNPW